MKKYKMRQEIGVTTEEGMTIKEFSVQMYLNAEGIKEKDILDMFVMYADNFTGLIQEESDQSEEEDSGSECKKGRWF